MKLKTRRFILKNNFIHLLITIESIKFNLTWHLGLLSHTFEIEVGNKIEIGFCAKQTISKSAPHQDMNTSAYIHIKPEVLSQSHLCLYKYTKMTKNLQEQESYIRRLK